MDIDIRSYPPQYREALEELRKILHLQTELAEKAESEFHVDRAVAQARWRDGLPLLADTLPTPSSRWFREAIADLRSLLPPGEPARAALDRLLSSDQMKSSNIEDILGHLLRDSDSCFQQLADATATTTPDIQAVVLRTILSPFFQKQVAAYGEWIKTVPWRHGICPMCGSPPWMARLSGENGQRFLACSLCRTEWNFDRLRCPFCENDDRPYLRYFTVEGDPAHRVDCCDRCHRYIKTVDERVLGRPTILLVEDAITVHMDELAREQGYQ